MNVMRHEIVYTANQYVGRVGVYGGKMRGADHLMKFLNEAGRNIVIWTPTSILERHQK